ncbi:MAG: radical SAM family heme chaperone HemW [Clostridia bacterium]|nr:radical SAM family heme chaperone HemW [Clostridia bacterium]
MRRLGIYIHIPFCLRKCGYCDFYSFRCVSPEREEQYVDALCKHIAFECSLLDGYEADTVFLGGGTPSILTTQSMDKIFQTLRESIKIKEDAEITVEANPGTVTREKLECYMRNGINRLSIGMQSTKDSELSRLGRAHTFKDFEESYRLARECGFKNISVDVMFALPDQDLEGFVETLDRVCELDPEHISVYCLKIEEGTFFYDIKENLALPSDEEQYEMYTTMCELLEKRGWRQYEISNFAKKGYRSRHNLKYWLSQEYIGFGPSAYSFVAGVRYHYPADINSFIEQAQLGLVESEIDEVVKKDNDDSEEALINEINEYVMLKLRLNEGVSCEEFYEEFGYNFEAMYYKIEKYTRTGHVIKRDGRYFFSPKGFFVSNHILADILYQ